MDKNTLISKLKSRVAKETDESRKAKLKAKIEALESKTITK